MLFYESAYQDIQQFKRSWKDDLKKDGFVSCRGIYVFEVGINIDTISRKTSYAKLMSLLRSHYKNLAGKDFPDCAPDGMHYLLFVMSGRNYKGDLLLDDYYFADLDSLYSAIKRVLRFDDLAESSRFTINELCSVILENDDFAVRLKDLLKD